MNGNMLMTLLRNRNPKAYEQIEAMRKSGTNPVEWLREQYSNGKITKNQLLQVKKYASMFGMTITDEQIRKVTDGRDALQKKTDKGWF